MTGNENNNIAVPESIEEVIERLLEKLTLREKTKIAKLEEDDLIILHPTLGSFIRNNYLWNGNEPLMIDCMHRSGRDDVDEDGAALIIIHALWKKLKETHRLRVVK